MAALLVPAQRHVLLLNTSCSDYVDLYAISCVDIPLGCGHEHILHQRHCLVLGQGVSLHTFLVFVTNLENNNAC